MQLQHATLSITSKILDKRVQWIMGSLVCHNLCATIYVRFIFLCNIGMCTVILATGGTVGDVDTTAGGGVMCWLLRLILRLALLLILLAFRSRSNIQWLDKDHQTIMVRRWPWKDIPVCLVLLQLRQREGGNERGYFVFGVVVVRLLDKCRVEGSGRATTRDDRALREDVTSKRMWQCDCGVQREEGGCVVSRRTDSTKI